MSAGLLTAWIMLAPMQPVAEAVTVPADDACLSPGLASPIATWLGRDEVRADLTVEVVTGDDAIGFVLRRAGEIRVERMLSPAPADCADRRAALGLAIAMALDAAVLEAFVPPPPEPPPEPAEPDPPAHDDEEPLASPEPPPEPEPEPEPERGLRVALSAEADALLGVLPRIGFGGELGLSLGWVSWFDLRVDGGAAGGPAAPLAEGSVEAVIGWGALGVCPGRGFGRVHLRLCAGVGAGALRARGRGFGESRAVTLPWVAVRTGGELDVRLGERVALRARGMLLTPVVGSRFAVRDLVDEIVDVREPAVAGGQLGVGVVVRLAGPWR